MINQDFEFNVPLNEDTSIKGRVTEIVIQPKNNSVSPNQIQIAISAEMYPNKMPEFEKKIIVPVITVSEENYKLIMKEVFSQLGMFINSELGKKINDIVLGQKQ